MNMENTINKFYADENGLVLLVCPKCSEGQNGHTKVYRPVKIHCKCGNTYNVIVERRKFSRKEIRFDGIYSIASNPDNLEKMIVKNISVQGCGFETLNPNMLKADEEIRIEFKLDDDKNSRIMERAIIHFRYRNYVSCRFIEQSGVFYSQLQSYMSNA
jgi:hypothetical protein